MDKSEKNVLQSNLQILLIHLLKWKYQREHHFTSWSFTIRERNISINKAFKDSPSLKPYFVEILDNYDQDARKLAAKETD